MNPNRLLLLRHHSPLKTIHEAEVLTALSKDELSISRGEVIIDSRPLEESVEGGHWRSSDQFVRQAAEMLRAEVARGAGEVHYFSMAEVPHVVGIGAHFGDETLVYAHDYDRGRDTWAWPTQNTLLEVGVHGMPHEVVLQPGEAVLIIEVSYPLNQHDVDAIVGSEVLATIRIRALPDPIPGIVRSHDDVRTIREKVRDALAAIAEYRPGTRMIHLFVAAPVSVCFGVGQELRLRNGRDVMTYRYRTAEPTERYKPAILLTARGLVQGSRVVSEEERTLAAELRQVFAAALEDVKLHAGRISRTDNWYTDLQPDDILDNIKPFVTLAPLSSVVHKDDQFSLDARETEYAFPKERPRTWEMSDALVMSFFTAAGEERKRLQALVRLFFYHEYLHDWQDLTKYTAEDVGSFANCLEAIDYMADTYAFLHQLDHALQVQKVSREDAQHYLVDQISLALASFWAFEPSVQPNYEWQERRLRRYLNWYWRRVQIREAPDLAMAIRTLARRPSIEIAGFKYRTGGGRHFVSLNEPRAGDVPELGIVLEDGRFHRRGTTTDLGIEALMRAFGESDIDAIDRFFNSLFEHLKATGGVFAEE